MDMLDIYTDYLICQNKHATATGLSDMVDGEFSHDKVTRFLRLNSFDSKMLWAYVKAAVRERETQSGVLILDDSIEDKPYTDENDTKHIVWRKCLVSSIFKLCMWVCIIPS